MKKSQNDDYHAEDSRNKSNQHTYEDYDQLETNPNLEMLYIGDDDEVQSNDFVMYNTDEQDYDD